ncbi:hypothetical protein [Pseudogemmobacter sonorensis]|uniref:hypothetical protein n=1 Tax=Pseudogemmobacter sonorensis TaxID=2989681 RepID=UPI0036748A64
MTMYVNVRIRIEGEGLSFGSSESEAKAIVAEYLRDLAENVERAEDSSAGGDIQDSDTGVIVGRIEFDFLG